MDILESDISAAPESASLAAESAGLAAGALGDIRVHVSGNTEAVRALESPTDPDAISINAETLRVTLRDIR